MDARPHILGNPSSCQCQSSPFLNVVDVSGCFPELLNGCVQRNNHAEISHT